MKKRSKPPMVILVDSREQKPYRFPEYEVRGLKTGDYSLAGLEDKVVIERKSKIDCYSSLGTGRKRFQKELERMAEIDYAAIVIESSLRDFLDPPPFSQLNPKSAINTLISWSIRYGVHIIFCDNRRLARAVTYRILEKFWRNTGTVNFPPAD